MMPDPYRRLRQRLIDHPRAWLVTGGAGFIGSHLVETLLSLDQAVTCLDNLSSGTLKNLEHVLGAVTPEQRDRFRLIEGDIADIETCRSACAGADHILHQAGIGSVPASLESPAASHRSNVTGTVNLFTAARDVGIERVVFASSCSVYGDHPELPKTEDSPTPILTPYAASKRVCEIYGESFAHSFGLSVVALRYFNVFGPRQDPQGAYAAVIPQWIAALLNGEPISINGDGKNTRDFCPVEDVVQANLLAAASSDLPPGCHAFNVASGKPLSLNDLAAALRDAVSRLRPDLEITDPVHRDFRDGDIRYSSASIERIEKALGFEPAGSFADGLNRAMTWYAAEPEESSSS